MEKTFLKVKSLFRKVTTWIKHNPYGAILLILILAISAICRLYRISEYMTFLGDEGRDVIVVRRLLVNFDPILVGPGTSIGDMYLGPLYYYMMAPALLLANFSPVGPAIQVALLGIATVLLVWVVAREWFGDVAAFVASGIYALSPTVIIHSRSSWNPNIMPFFALLTIYSVWRIWKFRERKWLIVLGLSYAFVLQSHYLGLLLAPAIGLFLLPTFLRTDSRTESRAFFKSALVGLLIFGFLMSPLLIFDARHGWRNFSAMKKFFTERQTTVSIKPWNAIPRVWPQFEKVNTRLLAGRNEKAGKDLSLGVAFSLLLLAVLLRKDLKPKHKSPYYLLITWFGLGLLGLSLYKQEIYDHYYGFIFPAPFILLGGLVERFVKIPNLIVKIAVLIALSIPLYFNLIDNPLRYQPNRHLQRSQDVASRIKLEAQGEKFNLAVIAERNYEDGYGYFLEAWGETVLHADKWDKNTISDQLFVVCELPQNKCDPTHSPEAEIANFGWTKIDKEFDVDGVRVYRLVHSQ